jgi:hypothetical protein
VAVAFVGVWDREVFQTSGTSRRGHFPNRIPAIGRNLLDLQQICHFIEDGRNIGLCTGMPCSSLLMRCRTAISLSFAKTVSPSLARFPGILQGAF